MVNMPLTSTDSTIDAVPQNHTTDGSVRLLEVVYVIKSDGEMYPHFLNITIPHTFHFEPSNIILAPIPYSKVSITTASNIPQEPKLIFTAKNHLMANFINKGDLVIANIISNKEPLDKSVIVFMGNGEYCLGRYNKISHPNEIDRFKNADGYLTFDQFQNKYPLQHPIMNKDIIAQVTIVIRNSGEDNKKAVDS